MHKSVVIIELDLKLSFEDIFYYIYSELKPEYFSFLDSSLTPNKYSRFSYIGWEPEFALKSQGHGNEVIDCKSRGIKKYNMHPMVFLRKKFSDYIDNSSFKKKIINEKNDIFTGKIPDFLGGFIGYFSYDLKNYLEKLPDTVIDDTGIPLFYLVYYSKLLVRDHVNKKSYLIINPTIKISEDFNEAVRLEKIRTIEMLDKIPGKNKKGYGSINERLKGKYSSKKINEINLISNFSKAKYLEAVRIAKNYIHDGDIYQVNMTQRFSCFLDADPVDVYYILRQKNPAPFSGFFSFPEFQIGSSSPERFLFLKNGYIETRPIKGTRPIGRNKKEEEKYFQELKKSIKDRAELNMIVDLERNDLGKFSKYGTVKVAEHAVIEKFAKVQHLVSTVVGEVKNGYDIVDIIKATFPGGSITGAPKIRAMQIIDELEPTVRSVYTGAIGYVGFDGTMDINIVIRTFIIKNKIFYYNVGGGIVEDSDPEAEFQETLDKGLALKETLEYFVDN